MPSHAIACHRIFCNAFYANYNYNYNYNYNFNFNFNFSFNYNFNFNFTPAPERRNVENLLITCSQTVENQTGAPRGSSRYLFSSLPPSGG